MMKVWIVGGLLLAIPHSALATSIAAQIEADRIYLAVDSRNTHLQLGTHTDDMCKIILFKDAAFAVSGHSDMIFPDNGEVAWDGFKLAKTAFADNKGNLIDASNAWSTRSLKFFTPFFSHQVPDGERMLKEGGSEIATSVFAGFFRSPDRPRIVIGSVHVDREGPPPRKPGLVQEILLPREQPYSSNGLTEELMNGTTERARLAQAEWSKKAKLIKPSDRDVRRLVFFIKETGKYDPHVGGPVNVLEITSNNPPRWLQNRTCR